MASVTMTASFLGGSAAAISKQQPLTTRRGGVVMMAKASKVTEADQTVMNVNEKKGKSSSAAGRRDTMFAVALAAACSIAKVAMADEFRRGSSDAKKKYGPVCVTMPTARICNK